MTTLTAPDITTSASLDRRQLAPSSELEYFSSHQQASSDIGDRCRWAVWLQKIIDNPDAIEDDVVTAPSREAVSIAFNFLDHLNSSNAPPDIVSLGPNGEIVFERDAEGDAEQIVIYDDLRVDFMMYRNGRLEHRQVISRPEPVFAW